jgi:hypothetical protein
MDAALDDPCSLILPSPVLVDNGDGPFWYALRLEPGGG